jgi:NADP-dependent aldehyde dehydrogenase
VQLLYRTSHADGERLVADHRIGATGYTGSRAAGLALKSAADRAGKPIYLELSSVNPVVILPDALAERADEIAGEFLASCLMGTGQFCTNPGLVLLLDGQPTEAWIGALTDRFRAAAVGTLLSAGVAASLAAGVRRWLDSGARLLVGGEPGGGAGHCFRNTLVRASGAQFLTSAAALQTEAFGNASLLVTCANLDELLRVIDALEGNLTGTIYSARAGADEAAYARIAPRLRAKVGRLLNDKMPTGVAVSSAMNHGGPFPATGHPGFTAVGIPAAIRRFAMLQCYDNVRPPRLPPSLQDASPGRGLQRLVDGRWTSEDIRR